MQLTIYQVDAFAERLFTGNPAAVVPLQSWLPDDLLLAIAAENNLSETAYLVPAGEGWELRWFTPAAEVDLCGHATVAAAFALDRLMGQGRDRYRFATRFAGDLAVDRQGDLYALDFPARPPVPVAVDPGLLPALGGPAPREVLAARDYLVVYEDAAQVLALAPDMTALRTVDRMVIVTAPGGGAHADVDFVSRFFAPGHGIPEDPVTGSAHCTLIPYWAGRLGKAEMRARQVSARSGDLSCTLAGDRVGIAGRAVHYMTGTIHL